MEKLYIPDSKFWSLDTRSGRVNIENPPEQVGITEPATLSELIAFRNKIFSPEIHEKIITGNNLGLITGIVSFWPLKYIMVAHPEENKFYLFNRYWGYLNWKKLLTDEEP